MRTRARVAPVLRAQNASSAAARTEKCRPSHTNIAAARSMSRCHGGGNFALSFLTGVVHQRCRLRRSFDEYVVVAYN
ncbi:hypothetical protein BE221DRAFT_205561 [Ostreococcus tauri]|uniref:Uncharacterized protein n=1 Tax=Ostreococcus tauri TaxID=70448 RepID=A0A1Y5IAF6_OSTTA|nr:hypothetical protein BE221DRAFT_205561 [Ostreococcus tauri]